MIKVGEGVCLPDYSADFGSGKIHSSVQNKRHLYNRVSEYLQEHPTTESSPLKFKVPGLPNPKVVPPAVPRGWKIGTILPSHSPAVSGGGVSENMFKDMMAEMQDQGGPAALGQGGGAGALPEWMGAMAGGGPSGGGEAKKEKKDKKKGKS
jgi:signal recognition particle subunit SRP19